MLTVALDATPLVGNRTGIGVAVEGMVRALAGRSDLDLVGYGLTGAGWHELREALPARVRPARARLPAAVCLRLWSRVSFPNLEPWTGPVDLVHGTNFVVPPTRRAARLVTVHDLTAVHYPEMCTPTSLRYPHLVQRAVDEGAWVHAVSSFVAGEVIEHFGADPGRVVVVPHGINAPRLPPGPRSDSPPYVLALGTVEPRKDFPGLVRAFDRIAGIHPDLELWIAGPSGWGESQLSEARESARYGERVKRLGWVDDRGDLLAGASLLAYPSLYEGFGFPPLEAMAAGVPVVATAAGSVPEVVGDAAVLVPPGDEEGLAVAISNVLRDEALRSELIERGHDRVRRFSWDACAAALNDAYGRVAASRN